MNPRLSCPAWVLFATFGAWTLAGCSKGGPAKHQTEQVEGVVTLDGKPVPGATVTFDPVDEKEGVTATGTTDDNGRYTLTTIGKGVTGKAGAGAVAGDYYVGVLKTSQPSSVEDTDDPNYGKQKPYSGKEEKPTDVVPVKYNDPRKSGIKVTVEKGKNDIPLKLATK